MRSIEDAQSLGSWEAGLSLGNLGQQVRDAKVKEEASQAGTTQLPCPGTSSR